MYRLADLLNRLACLFTGVAGIAMTVIVIIQVILRYFFNSSMYGADEIARLLMIWIAFIGGSVAFKQVKLARITILLDRLKVKVLNTVLLIGYLLIFAFLVVAAWKGFSLVSAQMVQLSPQLGLPMGVMYLGVPIGCVLMVYYDLLFIIEQVKELVGRPKSVNEQ